MPKTAQKDASVATVKKQGAVMKHIKKYWQCNDTYNASK